MGCEDAEVIASLMQLFATNESINNYQSRLRDCMDPGANHLPTLAELPANNNSHHHQQHQSPELGELIYAYCTPFILVGGIIFNFCSLSVFFAKELCQASARYYLIASSVSNSIVLVSHVLMDWLYNGLYLWPGASSIGLINVDGICQLFLFLSYMFRFVSVALIVAFTLERFIAVCKPLHRRRLCTKRAALKIIIAVHILAAIFSMHKPFLSGVFQPQNQVKKIIENRTQTPDLTDFKICTRRTEYDDLTLGLDFTYGLLITAVPFVIIIVFNLFIVQRLFINNQLFSASRKQLFKIRLRVQLTFTLIGISVAFILLSLPYFILWIQLFRKSLHPDNNVFDLKSAFYISKTVFNLRYAINFFVFCLTSQYYRRVLARMLCRKQGPYRTPPPSMSTAKGQSSSVRRLYNGIVIHGC